MTDDRHVPTPGTPVDPGDVVADFLATVRSGADPDAAERFMHRQVTCHQMTSEQECSIRRTPQEYAEHVRDMLHAYGRFRFDVTVQITEGDLVYAAWRQTAQHSRGRDGLIATGPPPIELGGAVYRVTDGKIAEYWISLDRLGLIRQLERADVGRVTTSEDDRTYVIVWRYEVSTVRRAEFLEAYGPRGDWVTLFSASSAYLGTDLVEGQAPGSFIVVDRWANQTAYDDFMRRHGDAYRRLGDRFQGIAESEELAARGTSATG